MKKSGKIILYFFFAFFTINSFASSGIWAREIALNFGSTNFIAGSSFNTQNLGSFVNSANYQLKGGRLNTWKNGNDDITGSRLKYRVRLQSDNADTVDFQTINLPFFQNLPNPGDQQWATSDEQILFMQGLAPGQYFLEVFFEADFTFPSGSGTHIDNNNVENFKAQFTIIDNTQNNCSFNLGPDVAICGFTEVVLGQGISVSPGNDSITIIYDASTGVSGLDTATKVYMHSGYEAVPFGGVVNWVGNWGQDDGLGKMTNIGGTLWKITINPNSYYNVPSGSPINGFLIVFRNASGTATGKDDNNNDIFLSYGTNPQSPFSGVTATFTASQWTTASWSTGQTTPEISVASSGTYILTLTNNVGCIASDTINVVANGLPFVTVSGERVFCKGLSTTLTATPGFAAYEWSSGQTTNQISVADSGTYVVTVTDQNGCTGFHVVYVVEIDEPNADFTTTGIGPNITFSVTSIYPNATYVWDFNGDGVNDNTTNPTNPVRGYSQNGSYNVRLIITNQCGSDTIIKAILVSGVGFEEYAFEQIQISPNPASRFITLNNVSDFENIYIYDLTGKAVVSIPSINEKNLFIDVANLSNGVYCIKFENPKIQITKKLIINH